MSIAVEKPATIEDLLSLEAAGGSFEIVRGVLVESPQIGLRECSLAATLIGHFQRFRTERDVGAVFNSHAKYRLARDPDIVRMPDVSFVKWERLPGRRV